MDRFVSHYMLRLDAKGRVSVPAPFRAVLARDGFDGLYCYPARDRPAVRRQRRHRTLRNRYTCGAQSARTARRLSSDGRATHS